MFAVRPTTVPFTSTVATVSNPDATRSTSPPPSPGHDSVVSYRQSVRAIHDTNPSLSSTNGSAINPAANKSRCTDPGTTAGTTTPTNSGGTSPPTARTVQPSWMQRRITGRPPSRG